MKFSRSLLILLCLSGCALQDTRDLDRRLAYWQGSLATELPAGSNSDQVTRWAKSHRVDFIFLPEQRQFYANVERVPVNGIKFPCGSWNIIIKITVDNAGRSTKNDISQVGNCV